MGLCLVLIAISLLACSGVPGLVLRRSRSGGQGISTALMILGAGIGVFGAVVALAGGGTMNSADWGLPFGPLTVGVDALSAVFLLPVFVVAGAGSFYGLGYWKHAEHADTGTKLRLFYGLLAGSLAMVTIARDGVMFLMAWEIMALSAYVLVTTESQDAEACAAGWTYLIATHLGTLCLIAMFALMRKASGSYAIGGLGGIGDGAANAIFLLALIGFGLKAGIMPLHVWLPGAHANAPSHVSALMSGVLIKMGVYGIIRICGILPQPPIWWGAALLVAGAASAVVGIAFAAVQRDLKRLLAYCSIENVGIIIMGVGLALVGRTAGRGDWVALGLGGALLHVWNHGLFKSLLFMGAGSVIHAAGTRQIDLLGGLGKRMPRTALLSIIGAAAICGLPPLNGFVSEFLIYLGLFRTLAAGEPSWVWAAFAAPALAMGGALAVACFVKLIGGVFLGEPRTSAAGEAHESPASMLRPMALLAGCCGVIGLLPILLAPALDRAITAWSATPSQPLRTLAPLGWITAMAIALAAAGIVGFVLLKRRLAAGVVDSTGTWDCGYAQPTARMQYTGSSFSQMVLSVFAGIFRPRTRSPRVEGPFPTPATFNSEVDDAILHRIIHPTLRRLENLLAHLRFLQQGRIQFYVLYILAIVVLLLWL